MRRAIVLALAPLLLACPSAPSSSGAPPLTPTSAPPIEVDGADPYTPIPDGFDFPAPQATLLALRDAHDVKGMRRHVWNVWNGLNQPAKGGGPVWETWFPNSVVFARGGPKAQGARSLARRFEVPRQHAPKGKAAPEGVGQSLLSFVLMNADAKQHVRDAKLWSAAELDRLNASWPAATKPIDRSVKAFPAKAVAIKVVWWLAKKDGLTAMPVWDDDPAHPDTETNPPSTWKRVVAIDPSRASVPAAETADVVFQGQKRPGAHVVGLDDFYHVRLAGPELDSARRVLGPDCAEGDYALLAGMHLTTKEIDDWVWATFWWHDRPDDGRYGADKPDALKGMFRRFRMEVAYDATTPVEPDGSPHACFNPWLEARFVDGRHSNCVTCHRRATWPMVDFLPITRGAMAPDDPLFTTRTRLDFLWSIAMESE